MKEMRRECTKTANNYREECRLTATFPTLIPDDGDTSLSFLRRDYLAITSAGLLDAPIQTVEVDQDQEHYSSCMMFVSKAADSAFPPNQQTLLLVVEVVCRLIWHRKPQICLKVL
jgi:hypothetical protein